MAPIGMFVFTAAGRPHAELRWVGLVLVVLGADTLLRLTLLALVGLASAVIVAWMATVAIADDFTTEAELEKEAENPYRCGPRCSIDMQEVRGSSPVTPTIPL